MKYFTAIVLLILAIALLTAHSADSTPPALAGGTVTIPYAELKSLWDAARAYEEKDTAPPPIAAALLSATYAVSWQTDSVEVSAHWVAEAFTEKWAAVPVLGSEVRVKSVSPPETRLVSGECGIALLLEGKGRAEVDVVYEVSATRWETGGSAVLKLPSAPVAKLSISSAPENETARVQTGQSPAVDAAMGGEVSVGGAGVVTISTIARGRQAEAAEQRWALRSEVLVVPGETTHRCRARVVAESLAGEAVGLDLVVPAVARVADVRGDDVREWRVDAPESGTRRLRVAWATARVPVRELQVVYELPANRAKTSVSAPMLKGGAPGEPWLLAVAEPDGAEVVVAKGAQTERRTPAWMREMIEGRPVALSEMKDTAELELKWLPRVETRDVVVSKAEYVQRIVADGAVLVSAGYEVATTAGGQLEVELPEGADLLSCEVAGKRTRPVMRDGTLSIPLPAGLGRGVNVAISFTAKLPPLDPVSGKLTLVLPRSPLFMREINWLLQIPAAYEISSLEGNAQFVESKRTEEACEVRLRKELCNGERPEVLAYYARSEKNP